jgi:hypothetical protein
MRYLMLLKSNPKQARKLMELAQKQVDEQWITYEKMASMYSREQQDSE